MRQWERSETQIPVVSALPTMPVPATYSRLRAAAECSGCCWCGEGGHMKVRCPGYQKNSMTERAVHYLDHINTRTRIWPQGQGA